MSPLWGFLFVSQECDRLCCGLIRQHRINILGFTPSYGSQLAQFLSTQNQILPVRMIITGGEADMWEWQKHLYGFLSRNARQARDYYNLPPMQIIEVGLPIQL